MKRPDYSFQPADFSKISTYSIDERTSVVKTGMFTDLATYGRSRKYTDLLPDFLKAGDLQKVVAAIRLAKEKGKPTLIGIGAHVIKCGLTPLLIDLMERGFIDAIAMNGAGAVHDLEIAFHGETSEIVATEITEGRFGMVEETAKHFNGALADAPVDRGIGEILGGYIEENTMPHRAVSLLAAGYRLAKPITVHSAIGTDIVHIHPNVSGADTGRSTLNDFKLFTGVVSQLGQGGVYLNIGSAVLLPEVFLKALSAARNLGADVSNFMTANFDMIQHYRPRQNVVNRPIQGAGAGVAITGHHEIMIPLLYHLLLDEGEAI